MSATTEHPKVFISYSWTTLEHEQFVVELATALRNHGVDAVLDKWDLKPGQDKYVFMESMVVDPQVGRVLVICDRRYQEKADARAGGVGTESQIISQELYGKVKQDKFIPVVCECDDEGQPCLPVFMKGRIYIDVSTDERYGEGLEQLLRLIYDQPFHQKPQLGAPPSFTSNKGAIRVKELGATIRAIHDGRPNRQGLERLFGKSLKAELDRLYVQPTGDDYDEGVYQAISETKSLRDQFAEYADAAAGFSGDDPNSLGPFFRLMEELGGHFGPPLQSGTFYPGWADFYSFFALEVLLIQVAVLIRHERWKSLRRLTSAIFVVRGPNGEQRAKSFVAFDVSLRSLDEHRNHRLQLKRVSVSADLIKERCSTDAVTFREVLQADIFLALRTVVQLGGEPVDGRGETWDPRTVVFYQHGDKLPLFLRAPDEEVRKGVQHAVGVASSDELRSRLESAGKRLNNFSSFQRRPFSSFGFLEAINAEQLTQ